MTREQPANTALGAARNDTWLWIAQRGSAVVLAACVSVHLVTIILAVRGGLTGAEILERVGGSAVWLGFYLLFVLAAALHAPIGLRAVLLETTALPRATVDGVCLLTGVLLFCAGADAVLALHGASG